MLLVDLKDLPPKYEEVQEDLPPMYDPATMPAVVNISAAQGIHW